MQITFAGTIIAQEPTQGGTDAVAGFMPSRKANAQWAEYLRAQDATPLARFNRKRVLAGTITQEPYASMDGAMASALVWLDGLPDAGVLVFLSGTEQVTFNNAVLTDLQIERKGLTLVARVTFQVGPGIAQNNAAVLTKPDGTVLTTPDGTPLTP